MEKFWKETKFAFRMLRKSPAFTAIAVLTLALGIGANTAMFSIVYGVLLRALPFPQPDRVVKIYTKSPQWNTQSISYPNFLDWQRRSQSFEQMACYRSDELNLTGAGEPTRVHAAMVTATFLPTLGIQPLMGRNLTPQEDVQGGNPVVLLTDAFWKSQFGGDPNVLGRAITFNDVSYTVVGIVPADTGIFMRRQVLIS